MALGDGIDTGNLNPGSEDGGNLGWRVQLPDDLKANETFTPFKTVGDFAKAHIETITKAKELEGKLSGSIPKLTPASSFSGHMLPAARWMC